ncbi:MAG: meso-butanediol dehydrogenase / (S,S)-butanediol dehydrogenase / diacetyl reductase [Frankiaceae bacterium]|jgi:meso-butanediol dehydrogenase/(S,S)-butanediol dehydrogenase/diacetyl reductase|nr:meso-butanediol dehydrogenase / (S,S)-butanediol dehydrogenase / diacetyl reductase [Frankiaceae bacterium]
MSGQSAGRIGGRVVAVTGGGSGIGAAIARGLAAEGAAVAVLDRDGSAADAVAGSITDSGGQALAVRADVTDRSSTVAALAATVERFGRLDVMFNNAGFNEPMPFLDITEDNFRAVMEVNALGVLIGIQEAARQFLAQGSGGKVVNTASIAGRTGFADFAPYSASKAAVISLTQAAARALAPQGITVNAFAPGVVATPLWTKLDADLERMGAGDAGFDSMAAGILLGRPAQPEDIVPTALFLAAADSDYITGQVIPIEGGMILV